MSASHYNAAPLQPAAAGAMMIQAEQEQEPRWLLRYELAFLAFFGFFNVCELCGSAGLRECILPVFTSTHRFAHGFVSDDAMWLGQMRCESTSLSLLWR